MIPPTLNAAAAKPIIVTNSFCGAETSRTVAQQTSSSHSSLEPFDVGNGAFNSSAFTMLHLYTRCTNHASHTFNVHCPHQLTDPVCARSLLGRPKTFSYYAFFTAPLASEMYGSVFMKGKKKGHRQRHF